MMRSMYSGVSGLKTHQTKMDVIGNNIANVNTVAYKSQSITFSELMYQTTQKASGPNELTGTGGTNARQIGLGVTSGAINTAIASQGATQTTGNPFDFCITGDSFFIVSDGSNNYFTRAGAFSVDSAGNLVMTSNGYNVMGWGVDEETMTVKKDTVAALRIMSAENMTYPPEATTKGYVTGILDKNDEDAATESGRAISLTFYDNLGYAYTAKFSIHSTEDDGAYYTQLDDILDSNGVSITAKYGVALSDIVKVNEGGSIDAKISLSYNRKANTSYAGKVFTYTSGNQQPTFDLTAAPAAGVTTDPTQATADTLKTVYYDLTNASMSTTTKGAIDDLLINCFGFSSTDIANIKTFSIDAETGTLTVTSKSVVGETLIYSTDNGSFSSVGGNNEGLMKLDFSDSIVDPTDNTKTISLQQFADITVDWSTTNMYNNSGTSTIGAKNGDKDGLGTGRKLGNMSGVTVQTNGEIYASYDNGMTRLLGQIAVAEFTNAAGLEKAGDNLYQASLNSGAFDGIGVDITASGGYMTTGVLEMSNVDLSAEFTEMITAQRGFQANSRIITVSDSMLEELVNLKR